MSPGIGGLSRSCFALNVTNVASHFVPTAASHRRRFSDTEAAANCLAQSMPLRIKKKNTQVVFFFSPLPVFSSTLPGSRKCKKTLSSSSSTIFSSSVVFFVFGRCAALTLPNNEALAPEADSTSVFSRKHSAPDQRQVRRAVIRACRSQSHLRRQDRTRKKMWLCNDQKQRAKVFRFRCPSGQLCECSE